MMKVSKKTVLIYSMVIKKKVLADVILVNICFRTWLISLLIFVFVFKINLSLCLSCGPSLKGKRSGKHGKL